MLFDAGVYLDHQPFCYDERLDDALILLLLLKAQRPPGAVFEPALRGQIAADGKRPRGLWHAFKKLRFIDPNTTCFDVGPGTRYDFSAQCLPLRLHLLTRARTLRLMRIVAILFLLTALAHSDEAPKPPDPLYETREQHDLNGIGKFFIGREIAQVMGHQAAGWLERPEREEEERTDLAVAALGLKPGEAVADIGCGTGFYASRMARIVGENGVVFGVDIQQEMLDLLVQKMKRLRVANVKPVLGAEKDPKLAAESCDLVLMVDVYHEFDFPYEMTRAMIPALKKGGRLVFIEFRGEDPKVPIKEVHKMTEAQVKKEMALHPELEWVETKKELPQQHVIIFRRK